MNISTHVNKAPGFLFPFLILFFTNSTLAQIEEVVVTAQKRAEDVQDVPISITTMSGDFLEDSGIRDLQNLSQFVPNLTMSKSSQVANQRIMMRGVGSVGNNAIDPSVAVFIDGVYYPRAASVVGGLSDIEMVEVLRGPQGTMFGRNASMGALNIRTRKPNDEFEAWLRGSYGDYDAVRVSGGVSGAVAQLISARVSFSHSNRDGYGENTFTTGSSKSGVGGWEDSSFRGSLDFRPSSNVNINLSVDWSEVENGGSVIETKADTVLPAYIGILGLLLAPDTSYGPTLATLIPPTVVPPGDVPETTNTFDYTINQDHQDTADDEQWGFAATIDWDVGEYTIRSITSMRNWDNTSLESALRLPADLFNRDTKYSTDTVSQEIQIISPIGDKLEYVAGFYYYSEDYEIDQNFDLGADWCSLALPNVGFVRTLSAGAPLATANGAAFLLQANCTAGAQDGAVDGYFQQDVTSYALFGQATYNINDQFRFTAGLRWTKDEKEGSFSQVVNNSTAGPTLGPLQPGLGIRITDVVPNLEFNDDELTWLVNGSYNINDDIMAFATYSTGYKSGGFNSDGGNRILPREYDSETVDNIEVGVKSTLLENRLVANLTWFHTKLDNFQDRQFDGTNFLVQNAGELTQQGIELDIQAQPVEQLFAVMGLSYLDSDFDSFTDATAMPARVAAFQNLGLVPPGQDLSGQRNHFSPKWQFSFMGEWSDNFSENLSWFARAEYQYVSEQNVGAETNQNPQSMQPGYDIVNARVGIRGQDARWEFAGFINNAFDEEYCQTIFNQPIGTTFGLVDGTTLGGMQRCVLGTPQTVGVEASYRF